MSVPENFAVKRDGRVGHLWEHYVLTAPLPYLLFKIAAIYGLGGFWLAYIVAALCIVPAYWFWRMDVAANEVMRRTDEVDQRIPVWDKVRLTGMLVSLLVFIVFDFMGKLPPRPFPFSF